MASGRAIEVPGAAGGGLGEGLVLGGGVIRVFRFHGRLQSLSEYETTIKSNDSGKRIVRGTSGDEGRLPRPLEIPADRGEGRDVFAGGASSPPSQGTGPPRTRGRREPSHAGRTSAHGPIDRALKVPHPGGAGDQAPGSGNRRQAAQARSRVARTAGVGRDSPWLVR